MKRKTVPGRGRAREWESEQRMREGDRSDCLPARPTRANVQPVGDALPLRADVFAVRVSEISIENIEYRQKETYSK